MRGRDEFIFGEVAFEKSMEHTHINLLNISRCENKVKEMRICARSVYLRESETFWRFIKDLMYKM